MKKYIPISEFDDRFRVVISNLEDITGETIDSAIGAIGYASKSTLKLYESFYSVNRQILGNTLIIDLECDLTKTYSDDVYSRMQEFFEKAHLYLIEGVYHKGAKKMLGGFGSEVTVQFLSPEPLNEFVITLITGKSKHELHNLVCEISDSFTIEEI